MNEIDGEFYSPDQSPTTPAVIPAKDSNVRPPGDMLKMMNPTPNGYSSVPNHKPKSEGEVKKHHESKNNIDHHKHSDHVKKKDEDPSKHKSSNSKPKEYSKEGKSENQAGQPDKEKKHSSHSDSSKSKDSSNKHSDHSKHSSSMKKEDKHKSDSVKKEHHSSEGKPKTDNFKENEKIKDSSSKEKSKEHKDKHKDKHRDKEHKDKHRDKEHKEKHKDKSSSDKSKDKSDKPKEKSDKPKDESHEKHKHSEKSKDRDHGEKSKDKEHSEKHKNKEHSEKHKDKEHGEKHKDKEHSDKHKDKEHGEKHRDKEHSEKHKDKEHSEKHKDKEHSEKHKNKEHSEKQKDKEHKEKHKEKHSEKHKEKIKEEKIKIKIEKPEQPESESSPGRLIIKEDISFKEEPMSEDDLPLSARHASILANESIKREPEEDSDDEPLSSRAKKMKAGKKKKKPTSDDDDDYEMEKKPKKRKKAASDDEEYDTKKPVKKVKKEKAPVKIKKEIKEEPVTQTSPKKRGKKEEEEQEVWKWWEEEKLEDGVKWKTLEHNGPVFAPPYERVPKYVKFYYDGKHMELSELTEEVAGFYGRMLDHEYTSKEVFNTNFFKDWRKVMTPEEKEIIKDLTKCNFNAFNDYYKQKSEERKNMTKEEKLEIRKQNEELTKKYGFCIIDGHKQKIGNFKIEPPGLFRGRGEHPKMGMLKRRIEAEDILINLGKEATPPEPPPGHKWREVRHDNTVSWLASWTENILGSTKYIMLNPSSKLKGEKDWQKYETARKLKAHAKRIRDEYQADFKSKEMKVRQRAVALYFIDKLALRAGNEKDEDTADTVGCCSLRVEHITLHEEKDGKEYVVDFDFLGKDSIRYNNSVPVEKRAYKNLKLFMENKQPGDDLFDRLNTSILNKYLNDLMEGLTAKVFRTYNASKTLQEQLDLLTKEEMSIPEKILAYNRANRAVAILCNHQRAVPKGFSKAMENLKTKMDEKEAQIREFKKELKAAKSAAKDGGLKDKQLYDKKKKRLAQLEEQLKKLEVQATDKEENKQIALGTSKLNYLDPRISVAWCKKWGVPIEKIYNRTQRDKFRWAIEMAGPDYKF